MRGFCSKTLVLEAVGSIFMVSDPRNKENRIHSHPNHDFGDEIKCQLRVFAPKPQFGRLWAQFSCFRIPETRKIEPTVPNHDFGDKIKCQLPGHIWDASFCSKTLVWEAVGAIFIVSDPRNKEN